MKPLLLLHARCRLLVIYLCLAFVGTPGLLGIVQAQEEWTSIYDGGYLDGAVAVGVDAACNIYVTGYSSNPSNAQDIVTIKYSPAGAQLWVRRYAGQGAGADSPVAMAVNGAGEVWIIASTLETVRAVTTIKYDTDGHQIFVQHLEGSGDNGTSANGIAVDDTGNCYVTGQTNWMVVTVKYSGAGQRLWVRTWDNFSSAVPISTALDPAGNLILAGTKRFPDHTFITKVNPAGSPVWEAQYDRGGLDFFQQVQAITVDSGGSIYVVGNQSSPALIKEMLTLKYDSQGHLQWAAVESGGSDQPLAGYAVNVDNQGNVFAVGKALTYYSSTILTVKYDSNGTNLWHSHSTQPVSAFSPLGGSASIVVDVAGSAYVVDHVGFRTVKYAPDGNLLWTKVKGGAFARALALDGLQNLVAVGNSGSTPGGFITVHYGQTNAPIQVRAFVSPAAVETFPGSNITFQALVTGQGPFTYQWRLNGVDLPGETNAILSGAGWDGGFSVMVSNNTGSVISPEALLVVHWPASVFTWSAPNDILPQGRPVTFHATAQGDSPLSYQWQLGGTNIVGATNAKFDLPAVSAASAGTYRVVVSNAYGLAVSDVSPLNVVPAGPLDHWYWREPLPQGNDLLSAVYGNGRYVMVGRNGAVLTSSDGVNWVSRNEERFQDLVKVIFSEGEFAAVGTKGDVFVSGDGLDWRKRGNLVTELPLNNIARGNGCWIVTEYNSPRYWFSTNGIDWFARHWDFQRVETTVAFGSGRFVVAAGDYLIRSSSNGLTWDSIPLKNGASILSYAGDRFIASTWGSVAVSTNGLQWEEKEITGALAEVAVASGKYFGIGYQDGLNAYNKFYGTAIEVSTNGLDWTSLEVPGLPCCSIPVYTLTSGPDGLVAAGNNGLTFHSSTGLTWEKIGGADNVNLRDLAYGNGRYVAVGNLGYTFTSLDGEHWSFHRLYIGANLRSIAFGQDTFVAISDNGKAYVSTDGENWQGHDDRASSLYGIIYSQSLFVAVGERGTIVTSADGTNWNPQIPVTNARLHGITFGNGLFVASGTLGTIVTSPDATNWTVRVSGTGYYWQSVAYGNDQFVAVGSGVLVSSSGTSWNFIPDILQGTGMDNLCFGNGVFLGTGEDGHILTSTNGTNWVSHYSGSHNNFRRALYVNGAFTTVANNGTIMQSAQLYPRLQLITNTFEGTALRVRSVPNCLHRIQASSDLQSWQDIFTFQNTAETTTYLDTEAPAYPKRFYRVNVP